LFLYLDNPPVLDNSCRSYRRKKIARIVRFGEIRHGRMETPHYNNHKCVNHLQRSFCSSLFNATFYLLVIKNKVQNFSLIWREFTQMPNIVINLMHEKSSSNVPFFGKMVQDYFQEATSRHPKLPIVQKIQYGLAVCVLPESFEKYYMAIESSARRNHKKAIREGCTIRRIEFNEHLDEIRAIWQSTDTRQGRLMPEKMREGKVSAITDPKSENHFHDYPYYGVFYENTMIGYCATLIAGEYAGIQQIYGHSDHLTRGVVPQMIIGVAKDLYTSYPDVKVLSYGTYFGAGETMRRFKKKFLMVPHKVKWIL
jgi:hypothetical protein